MSFDPLNILLLAIALVVFWRLKSVLGTRTGTEKPPAKPVEVKRNETSSSQDASGTVLRFPQNAPPPDVKDSEPAPPVWTGYAEAGSPVAAVLEKLAGSMPDFTPRSFVEGAKMAYEMVLEGFAKGDKSLLQNLLSRDVFDGFASAIDARSAAGQKVESRFVGIEKARIQQATLTGKIASITMEFESELISATYDKGGELIDGDPKHIRQVTDVWTFERDISSRDPNWKLVATQAPA